MKKIVLGGVGKILLLLSFSGLALYKKDVLQNRGVYASLTTWDTESSRTIFCEATLADGAVFPCNIFNRKIDEYNLWGLLKDDPLMHYDAVSLMTFPREKDLEAMGKILLEQRFEQDRSGMLHYLPLRSPIKGETRKITSISLSVLRLYLSPELEPTKEVLLNVHLRKN